MAVKHRKFIEHRFQNVLRITYTVYKLLYKVCVTMDGIEHLILCQSCSRIHSPSL
jgi:hypothetical protein